jgi:hypothetical protein
VLPAPSEVFEDPVVQRSVSSFPALTTCWNLLRNWLNNNLAEPKLCGVFKVF